MKSLLRIRPLLALLALALGGGLLRAAEPPRPNVLFIIVDDLTTTLSSHRWPGANTPHMDALAARGVRFERAYGQVPLCNPARASFLTGCYPERTGVLDLSTSFREAMPEAVTLPQLFKNHGYRVASVGKVFHVPDPETEHDIFHRAPLAFDQGILEEAKQGDPTDPPREFLRNARAGKAAPGGKAKAAKSAKSAKAARGPHRAYNRNYAASDRPDSDFTDHEIAERALDAIRELAGGPFFASVGFIRPHTPFVAPQWAFGAIDRSQIELPPYYAGEGEDTSSIPESSLRPNNNVFRYEPPTREQALDAIHAYLAAVHFVDHQIGRLLAELERLGLAERTFVALTGDHGFHLGEHGLWAKQTLFEEANHVPLLFAGPGIEPGVSRALVEQVDIYPTLASLAGLPLPEGQVQGVDLVPWLEDPAARGRVAVFSTLIAPHTQALGHSARNTRYRYIEWNGGADGVQLYDLASDPGQLVNLAGEEGHRRMQRRLRSLLREHLERVSVP